MNQQTDDNKKIAALQIIEGADTHPIADHRLVTLLEYVFYITPDSVTVTDFVEAARMAAKSFKIPKKVNIDPVTLVGVLCKIANQT